MCFKTILRPSFCQCEESFLTRAAKGLLQGGLMTREGAQAISTPRGLSLREAQYSILYRPEGSFSTSWLPPPLPSQSRRAESDPSRELGSPSMPNSSSASEIASMGAEVPARKATHFAKGWSGPRNSFIRTATSEVLSKFMLEVFQAGHPSDLRPAGLTVHLGVGREDGQDSFDLDANPLPQGGDGIVQMIHIRPTS
ncbi:MAG: hypothetical protein FD137_545 [Spirochaetes bacterium]|nr:MAG: hypothetical protein FD137_545 [Spirochaetota bacterium]